MSVYTLGHRPSYLQGLEEQAKSKALGRPNPFCKKGRVEGYNGGSMFPTAAGAWAHIFRNWERLHDKDFSVFEVDADWHAHTEPNLDGHPFNDLLVNRPIVREVPLTFPLAMDVYLMLQKEGVSSQVLHDTVGRLRQSDFNRGLAHAMRPPRPSFRDWKPGLCLQCHYPLKNHYPKCPGCGFPNPAFNEELISPTGAGLLASSLEHVLDCTRDSNACLDCLYAREVLMRYKSRGEAHGKATTGRPVSEEGAKAAEEDRCGAPVGGGTPEL